ncbi:MAG TPA: HD domain-containing protein [Thermodesulfobacteriota bacterium]|nr:HD domain-containing protein [Thermodesulfobacteriota bacterium]
MERKIEGQESGETSAAAEIEAVSEHGQRPGKRIVFRVPARGNVRLKKIIERVNADQELYAMWEASNVTAVRRLGMSDHGPVHVHIVTNIALKLLRLLVEHGIQPNVVREHDLTREEAEVTVVLAAMTHDLGMSIHRADHEQYSLFLARPKLKELLAGLYDIPTETILVSEILHAIISHRAAARPLTLEAGIVRVADSLDMAEGRTRIPFQAGSVNIHSISAAAIEKVVIEKGETKPIRIVVRMTNSAGIFQIDELVRNKLKGSGLDSYVEVKAAIEFETEKKLIQTFDL